MFIFGFSLLAFDFDKKKIYSIKKVNTLSFENVHRKHSRPILKNMF